MKRLFLTLSILVLAGCTSLMDKSHGYRGPIAVTVKPQDGIESPEPFVITSAHVETCGHGGCPRDDSYNHYRHKKLGYANQAVVFPREKLQLFISNAYANMLFTLAHPLYSNSFTERGIAPSRADETIPLTLDAEPFEAKLARIEGWAKEGKAKMAQFAPSTKEHHSGEQQYHRERYNLGNAVYQQIRMMREKYLPQFSPEEQARIKAKYNPIYKEWFYRYPEIVCYDSLNCQDEIKKPRTKHFYGL
ncbi:hypothetical protein [Pseudoalteromonas sp. MMG024]|uniref:hypothetical protein n=1 Tax=Pseudoalteromonas sp. MMG024 TaxID=2909980 RepID=UPI001F170747|nr:hypothetical protein [Pseudoalteromonas sp. MMG024]MCF6455238.1 hypothetical protein [Pseudoalteromonas sp. MMG024]